MSRQPDQTLNARVAAVVLVVVAAMAGGLAGTGFERNDGYSDNAFDWMLALLAAGPFLVGASVFGAASLVCQVLENRD
jgi:hypothetical protein